MRDLATTLEVPPTWPPWPPWGPWAPRSGGLPCRHVSTEELDGLRWSFSCEQVVWWVYMSLLYIYCVILCLRCLNSHRSWVERVISSPGTVQACPICPMPAAYGSTWPSQEETSGLPKSCSHHVQRKKTTTFPKQATSNHVKFTLPRLEMVWNGWNGSMSIYFQLNDVGWILILWVQSQHKSVQEAIQPSEFLKFHIWCLGGKT